MTCKDIRDLIPELIHNPGKYPEAEAHLEHCADCRAELAFLREVKEGIRVTLPEPTLAESIVPRVKLMRRLRWERSKRPVITAIALAAVLALTLILPGVFPGSDDPQFYANYDSETEAVLTSIDVEAGWQISMDEIALYLLENADMETIEELDLENYQVSI
jgi:predicted anti-sigma-YlaC factor YlaD